MAKLKPTEDTRSHRQKFIDAATEHSADLDRGAVEAFRKYVRQIARTPADNPKKGSRKAQDSAAIRVSTSHGCSHRTY